MIARALRAEIERSASLLRLRHPFFFGALPEATRSRRWGSTDGLVGLLGSSSQQDHASRLALRAFFFHLAAENGRSFVDVLESRCGLPAETLAFVASDRDVCMDGREEALDALDVVVEDPARLSGLREGLCAVIEQFDKLCEGAVRLGRSDDIHVSAA